MGCHFLLQGIFLTWGSNPGLPHCRQMLYCLSHQEIPKGCQRIDAFELWCWKRLLRVPWTARRSNQFILKEISPEYSLEGLIVKLKLQYFGHLMRRTDSLEKTLMLERLKAGREGDEDELVGWHHRLNGHGIEQVLGISDGQAGLACCSPWGHKELDVTE